MFVLKAGMKDKKEERRRKLRKLTQKYGKIQMTKEEEMRIEKNKWQHDKERLIIAENKSIFVPNNILADYSKEAFGKLIQCL